ncbi:MAG: hypothetical protein ISP81_05655 [Synechococcus sp. BS301-5m-G54]|nr:hypothetical protein [Synechococcus sp. BS301-5m-G54]MBL6796647.1 hypothetical protein [Synechococcus sp. BS307-5m-G34]
MAESSSSRVKIHVGVSRTGTTVLQRHVFPELRNHLVFAKKPFTSSISSLPVGWDSRLQFVDHCLQKPLQLRSSSERHHLAGKILFPVAIAASRQDSADQSVFRQHLSCVVRQMIEESQRDGRRLLISSERLAQTNFSIWAKKRNFSKSVVTTFPVYELCRAFLDASGQKPEVIVVLREPISYLRSNYIRMCEMRKKHGNSCLSADRFVARQARCEKAHPGTSALTAAMHQSFVSALEAVAEVKAVGFREQIASSDLCSLFGLEGEPGFSFAQFPRENRFTEMADDEATIERLITETLAKKGFLDRLHAEQRYE